MECSTHLVLQCCSKMYSAKKWKVHNIIMYIIHVHVHIIILCTWSCTRVTCACTCIIHVTLVQYHVYRMADNFRGVLIFVFFVADLAVTKISTHEN